MGFKVKVLLPVTMVALDSGYNSDGEETKAAIELVWYVTGTKYSDRALEEVKNALQKLVEDEMRGDIPRDRYDPSYG